MRLKIKFDEIKYAIEQASVEQHYFIDKKNHQVILISESKEDYKKKLEEAENDNFIAIEPRMPDQEIMESFVYNMTEDTFGIAEKFYDVLEQRKPVMKFLELINQLPELKKKWFKYKDKKMANETMNWLCINEIELEDKSFIPNIKIKELSIDEVKLPEEWETFGPVTCMNCHNKEGLITRYFELNVSNENMLIDKEIKRIMKEKYGIDDYGCIGGGDKEVLTASECPKCKSTHIFEDL